MAEQVRRPLSMVTDRRSADHQRAVDPNLIFFFKKVAHHGIRPKDVHMISWAKRA
jgi:hypothetical protein